MTDYKAPFVSLTEFEEQMEKEERASRTIMRVLIGGTVAVIAIGVMMHSCTEAVVKTAENQERYYSRQAVQLSEEQKQYKAFFMKNGNEAHAVVMAQAITQPEIKPHNRPILAAVAVAETGADPTIRNTGWKNRHSGAFQVSHVHGPVSESPYQQALQAQQILDELMASNARGANRWRPALIKYNGGITVAGKAIAARYADRVVKLAKEVR